MSRLDSACHPQPSAPNPPSLEGFTPPPHPRASPHSLLKRIVGLLNFDPFSGHLLGYLFDHLQAPSAPKWHPFGDQFWGFWLTWSTSAKHTLAAARAQFSFLITYPKRRHFRRHLKLQIARESLQSPLEAAPEPVLERFSF